MVDDEFVRWDGDRGEGWMGGGEGGGEWYCFGGPDTEAWSTMPARALPLVFLLFLCTHLVLWHIRDEIALSLFFPISLHTLLLARPVNPLCQNSVTYPGCLCFTCFFPSLALMSGSSLLLSSVHVYSCGAVLSCFLFLWLSLLCGSLSLPIHL